MLAKQELLLSSLPLLALPWGLHQLRRLFEAYARGAYFSPAAALHLGNTGRAIGLWIVIGLICEPLLGIWLGLLAPPGERSFSFGFAASDLAGLFLAACIVLIGQILRRASELHAEHRLFV